MNLKSKKGFTLIELIVVIAILGVLVLLAAPRLLGYTEKAQLTRIQHDTKIMEQEMEQIIIHDELKIDSFDKNKKELGMLVMQEKLFEKEGVAKKVDKRHLSSSRYNSRDSLGVGGENYEISAQAEDVESISDDGYKIVPSTYKGKIKTKLKGTFYTNENGKVYYENDKPLTGADKDVGISCESPEALPEYDFDHSTGTIVKWNGNAEHLVIPFAFKDPSTGKCTTVKIIGRGAFMQGGFQTIVIPDTVVKIEDGAFKDNELTEIDIPHSVVEVGESAFDNNKITPGDATYGDKETIFVGGKDFEQNGPTGSETITPEYKAPSADDVEVIFNPETGTIIAGDSQNTSKPGKPGITQDEITIPDEINVGGVNYPVLEIAKGAYQGLGLKSVVLPSGLERIEDYAFSGNQLRGITIPEKVSYIGHYAFAFNEQTHSQNGKKRATIKTIKMQNGSILEEQFSKLDKLGDIQVGGAKASKVGIIQLRDFIFVTSIGNHVIDNEQEGSEPTGPSSKGIYSAEQIANFVKAGYTKIESPEDLNAVRNDLSGKYIQTKDIDLSKYGAGDGWEPIGTFSDGFTGIYDGGGFKNTGLKINRPTEGRVGLFGYVKNSEIKNIGLENVNVIGDFLVGGLVGWSVDNSKVSSSYVTGSVTGDRDVGGLVGKNYNGAAILNSHSSANVSGSGDAIGGLVGNNNGYLLGDRIYSSIDSSYFTGTVTGSASKVGGITGYNYNAVITDSYSTGSVMGSQKIGGLIGDNHAGANVYTSYAAGSVSGSKYLGGLIGSTLEGYESKSHYDRETTGQNSSAGGSGRSTSEMKKKATYTGWSDTIWELKDGQYPTLKNAPKLK